MGNASGKEELENGGGGFSATRGGGEIPSDATARQSLSLDSMAETPPASPRRSRSPLLFSHQVPPSPFQRVVDGHQMQSQLWGNDCQSPSNISTEKGIPTLISWYHGGNDVAVEGSWDNWSSRKALHRSGKDHSVLLVLPSGIYHYKFIIDGQWRFIPDLPHMTDTAGHTANILQVTDYVPENLDSIAEFEAPPSPESSYGSMFPVDDDFAKEPPTLPPQLPLMEPGLRSLEMYSSPKKHQHVELNHLFIEKGWGSQSLVALNITHRFHSKYVTVALYKPLKR
ncbi:SNF1-related protein kinase regulatory subunit beta-1 [Apostasia shenzhenica]|uniref:SNF1-related protein kinase regulatory subunit beta-1 n=1 Tax=Apostasia shenzhenica TaxID=1088818 RepID=A0A2I0AIH4_9ASPA|nr:SNF1-related protein kinase regulatory subunit beta-1 [Apostasia shenzhenica]